MLASTKPRAAAVATLAAAAARPRAAVTAALAGGAALLAAAAASVVAPSHGRLLVAAAVGIPLAIVLVWRPVLALAALTGSVILLEADQQGFLPATARFYRPLPAHIATTDLLFAALVAAVALDLYRRRQIVAVPAALAAPLVVLSAALLIGAVAGKEHGGPTRLILNDARSLIYLVITPILVLQVIRTRRAVLTAVYAIAALATVKAVIGLIGWVLGRGRAINGTHLTYYDPTANFVMLLFISMMVVAAVARVRAPGWMWVAAPVSAVALLLSYRRSFWIAAVLALVLAAILAASRRSRPLVVLAIATAVAAGALSLSSFGSAGTQPGSGVAARVATLAPSHLTAANDDRYRLDEIHNVTRAIAGQPLTGLGLGVSWDVVSPVSEVHPGGTLYTHVNALWYLMKMGPLGLLGYLLWYAAALWLAWRGWRRAAEPLVRVAALGAFVALTGLVVVELTASFTGVDLRLTLVVATLVALLAVAGGLVGVEGAGDHPVDAVALPQPGRLGAGGLQRGGNPDHRISPRPGLSKRDGL